MQKTLTQALTDLMADNTGAVVKSAKVSDARANGEVFVDTPDGAKPVSMANDQPQQAGRQLWFFETPDGLRVGLGENI